MSADPNSVVNQGQFHSSVAPTAGDQRGGHQLGRQVNENDTTPTFAAETLPAGSAPKDMTHRPNANDETPNLVDHQDNNDPESERQNAQDTIGGATSADVHTGLGKPIQGQSSAELRHDGSSHAVKSGSGTIGLTATKQGTVEPRDPAFADQRGIQREDESKRVGGPKGGVRGNAGPDETADDRQPSSA